jgi:hypothetical protein
MSNVLISRKTIIDITINLFEKSQKVSRKNFNFFTRIDLSEPITKVEYKIRYSSLAIVLRVEKAVFNSCIEDVPHINHSQL